jgi:hypothetical protein
MYQLVDHKGKLVVVNDLSSCASQDEAIAALAQAEAYVRTRPPGSVLLLTDVSDLRYDVHGVEAMKNFSSAVTPHIKASCVVGISGVKSVIYRSILRVTGRKIPLFESRGGALDWLAAQ